MIDVELKDNLGDGKFCWVRNDDNGEWLPSFIYEYLPEYNGEHPWYNGDNCFAQAKPMTLEEAKKFIP